jgi:BolA protein
MNIQTIKRHKSIYKALGKIMDEIHALSIHTFDEDEYQKNPMVIDSPQCAHKTT